MTEEEIKLCKRTYISKQGVNHNISRGHRDRDRQETKRVSGRVRSRNKDSCVMMMRKVENEEEILAPCASYSPVLLRCIFALESVSNIALIQ